MESAVIIPRRSPIARARRRLIVAAVATLGIAASAAPGSAQNFFDFLFGNQRRMPPSASSYADPNAGNPVERREPRVETGPSVAFCVRTCDGRYFPMQRMSNANAAQVCSSFCPAAKTKVYSGGAIDQASASDGSRYKDLPTAFAYREKTVADCTCNGKDPYGLVTTQATDDPTLRAGDIVATDKGLMAYGGGRRHGEFTPLASHPGNSDVKERLTGARMVPRDATPVPLADNRPGDNKRAQAER
jgi:hypothetical protein